MLPALIGPRFLSLFVVGLLAHLPAVAAAQEEPPRPAAGAMIAPRPLTPLTLDDPGEGLGPATVVVELTVNKDGTVRSARVITGEEPFAGAAVTAARDFRFEPATRDGIAVAATIRIEVIFRGQPPPAPETTPGAAAPTAPGNGAPTAPGAAAPSATQGAAPAEVVPVDVVVRGEPIAPAATSLSRAEVRLLPGAFGDPFRAIEVMPSVTPIVSGLPFFYVRGAPPGDVGYFLDGIRVPLIYHISFGPSVIHPGLVDRVDLHPGGYPARFGRFAGGIVSGETRGPSPEAHGEGNLRLIDVGAMVEVPFDGGRGAALVGGRYSYTAALLSIVAPDVVLDYWDYQARVSYDLTPRDTVTVFAFGAYDFLGQREEEEDTTRILFSTTFHRADLRYDHRTTGGGRLRHAITLGYDQTDLDEGRSTVDRLLGFRSELTEPLGSTVEVRAGVDTMLDFYDVDLRSKEGGADDDEEEFILQFPTRRDIAVGAHADLVLTPETWLEVTPGLRLDLYGSAGNTAMSVDPRLSARFLVTDRIRLMHALGLASQPPGFVLPGPGFQVGGLQGGLQRSLQTSAGFEAYLPEDITGSITFFHNAFFNMNDPLGTANPSEDGPGDLDGRSEGWALGMEVTLRRRLTRRLGGFLAYTLARSVRRTDGASFPARFDRTHVLNLAVGYDIGRGVRAGGRVVFYTGTPTSVPGGDDAGQAGRLSPFFRLDARLEKRWSLSQTVWLSVVLEALNTTFSKEAVSLECTDAGKCTEQTLGPVTIPSVGLEGGF